MSGNIPYWIKPKVGDRREYVKVEEILRKCGLNTVCIESNCPNRFACFPDGSVTFLILGKECTRTCSYCNIKVKTSGFGNVDEEEPEKVAEVVKELKMRHVVITSVSRDDLDDGGAEIFVRCAALIKSASPSCIVELLIPDFGGNKEAIEKIAKSKADVIAHNVEVVKRLYPKLRPQGSYELALNILKMVKKIMPDKLTKSAIILGLGENWGEIIEALRDLRNSGCDVVVLGQYLQPTNANVKVAKFYTPREFEKLKNIALEMGFKSVVSEPLARSSYRARDIFLSVEDVA